uniref:Uncharacterized protein n=1 Tax=Arundo donax TaxID=35708 RepID=A0A0A9MMV6_ARUDO
MTPASQPR